MSAVEQAWCRSLPWRAFTRRVVFPWAIGDTDLHGDVLALGSGSGACPRCGRDFAGADRDAVADEVVRHAAAAHRHTLDRDVALAHIEGVHPYDRDI